MKYGIFILTIYYLWILKNGLTKIIFKNVGKTYHPKFLFESQKVALKDITFEIRNEVFTIIGISGSGKTALLKCLCNPGSISHGEIIFSPPASILSISYFGLLYSEPYDRNELCNRYVNRYHLDSNITALITAYNCLKIDDIMKLKIDSLLESQRHLFNIYLGIQNSFPVDHRNHNMSNTYILMAFDEYLDKISSKVRYVVLERLQFLIKQYESINISCSVIVATHSEVALGQCNSRCMVIHRGMIYDLQTFPNKLLRPAQLQLMN
jgi:energy-coupling factor transporter ATP-binding protein EcfA2